MLTASCSCCFCTFLIVLPCNIFTAKMKVKKVTEHRLPELIPVLGSQPAGDVSRNPGGRLPLLSARPAVTPTTLKRVLPISLLGEQRHNGCEQFAQDCYPTVSRLQFKPRPFCAWVQHANHSSSEPPLCKHRLLLMCELFPACIVAIVPLVTKDQTIKWVLVTINPGLLAEWQLKRGSGSGDVLMLLLMLCCLNFVPVMICYIIIHVI